MRADAPAMMLGGAPFIGGSMLKRTVIPILALAVLATQLIPTLCFAQALSEVVAERLRARIEAAGSPPEITIGEERIYASLALPLFYERRVYKPAWSDDNGPLPIADELVTAIGKADLEGLRPADYHLDRIDRTLAEVKDNRAQSKPLNPGRLVDLDLLLTDAFLLYGSHLLAGRVNPETIGSEWIANRRDMDMAKVLQDALGAGRVSLALQDLVPPQRGYATLRAALAKYRKIAADGGWPSVSEGIKLQKGDSAERVGALCSRLEAEGYKVNGSPASMFGDDLDLAVREFQRLHGLGVDGVVGPATIATLNTPAEQRVKQIEVNMERWRWLPQDLGRRHILVNIAGFELDVIEDSQAVLTTRVVVGKDYRRTPVFSDKVTYLVLSPYWYVPNALAVLDILPQLRKDPDYLSKKNMRVFRNWGAEAKELDPKSIDWPTVTASNFKYRFVQDPGETNALGRVKFMFPNKFNVYLHDTPAKELFAKSERAFSSGCIRIENPIDLALYLLRGDAMWTRDSILAAIRKDSEQTVRLREPVPVHLLYWTAWADDDGKVHFRKDIYQRDTKLLNALHESPPDG